MRFILQIQKLFLYLYRWK